MKEGECQCAEYGDAETRDRKSRHKSCKDPKKKPIDNKGEESKREDIDRKRENEENRFEYHGDNPPHDREEECCRETLNMDPWYEIGNDEKHECGEEPTSKERHRRGFFTSVAHLLEGCVHCKK